jgi:quercetin dioxygenase-like cupin family protein
VTLSHRGCLIDIARRHEPVLSYGGKEKSAQMSQRRRAMSDLSKIDPSLYSKQKFNPSKDDPLEIIYEVTNHIPGMQWGVAFADITESPRHMHEHTHETYLHVEGPPLRVELGDDRQVHILNPGESLDIPLNTAHKAISEGSGPARIVVTTVPAFSEDDYHLLESPPE